MKTDNTLIPFLKWPGGKRWFVKKYSNLLPNTYNRYIEPFLGGGSVFFYLQPKKALLGDINPDVIAAYQGLKQNWEYIDLALRLHQHQHSSNHYYKIRENEYANLLEQASRMIYLNRTCFNGIYRVNLNGRFNVPLGTKTKVTLDTDDFSAISKLLKKAKIHLCDFEVLINKAQRDDLLFVDPPYTVRHNLNGFVKYNETLFSWEDQERLARSLIRARNRGAKIVATNANHESIRELYQNHGFYLQTVSRYSSIAAAAANRKQFEELVILSHLTN
ncbi:DNA adenine methylase [Pontibacter arcticus]|uniref:Site-specific DNA-methyltransferase (adenine-specific) n=1 Tax=Pontibacter arcticus TaxID=2080288 RepID=A0A364RID0_9BACT|nr:Dam family site-specific DNA-(adenine-N6)-methyltransferase [Pontibacter arcticus]RAU84059.1 DNA methyltransferase [Pontibacter arcticus]